PAVLAATMSAHSGAMNSLAASTTHDIYLPISGRRADDPRTLRMAKMFTLFWGVILLVAALLYRQQGTPVVVIALSIASFTYGALLGGFFLGMLWSRAAQRDRSEEHTSELQSLAYLVCRLLLERCHSSRDLHSFPTRRSSDLLRMAKMFTLFWGVILLVAALLYRQQGTPVVVIALSIASFTYGALLGGFFLGMLWSRAAQRDAISGMAVGIVVMSFIVFAKQMMAIFPGMTAP